MMQLLSGGLPLSSSAYLSSQGESMKSTHHFRDQLSAISGWFEQWNECEQTVALYSLIQKIGPVHARFLSFVLDQNLSQYISELSHQQQQANDPAYISCLSNESKEVAVTQLLSCLPLLRPGNEEAKEQYLSLIPKILAHSVHHSMHIEESRQLLSYSLIHPAITNDDRRSLTLWLRQLEDRIHNCSMYPLPSVVPYGGNSMPQHSVQQQPPPQQTTVNGGSVSQVDRFGVNSNSNTSSLGNQMDMWRPGPLMGLNGHHLAVDVNGYSTMNNFGSNSLPPGIGSHHMALHPLNSAPSTGMTPRADGTHTLPTAHSRIRRSSSLTPPGNTPVRNGRPPSTTDWSRECNGGIVMNGSNSSHKADHALLSPQSSAASSGSGSESQKDDKDVFSQEGSGMRDVPSWLKSLRLHKYSYIFRSMSYEEMMDLTESKLEKMNITKGARHKIVLSIQKLRERQSALQMLEKDLQDGSGSIKSALNEMKAMLQTPIKVFSPMYSQDSQDASSQSGASDSSGSDPPSPPQTPTGNEGDVAQIAEGDIPGQMTRLMGKICSSLLISPHQEEENRNYFIMLIDKCLSHEAFTPLQKRRLFSWKQQIQKICHPLPPRRSLDNRQNKSKWTGFNHNSSPHNPDIGGIPTTGSSLRRRMPVHLQPSAQRMPLPRPGCGDFPSPQAIPRGSLSSVIKRPSLQDHMKPHVHVQRTNSAPVRPNPLPASMFGKSDGATDNTNDPEINIRLESLCLSVTEHALGSFDGAVPLF